MYGRMESADGILRYSVLAHGTRLRALVEPTFCPWVRGAGPGHTFAISALQVTI